MSTRISRLPALLLACVGLVALIVGALGVFIGAGGLWDNWRNPHAAASLVAGLVIGAAGLWGCQTCRNKLQMPPGHSR